MVDCRLQKTDCTNRKVSILQSLSPRLIRPHWNLQSVITRRCPMKPVLDWLTKNYASLVRSLADLVAVPSISTDGEHQKEIDKTAALTCEQMRQAGLQNVEILR